MNRYQLAAAVLHFAEGTIGPVDFHPQSCGTCATAVDLVAHVDRTYPPSTPASDMPVFVIKGKDKFAADTLNAYLLICRFAGLTEQAKQVELARQEILAWQSQHPDLVKLPDHHHVPAGHRLDGELQELHWLFDMQQKRLNEATARWRAEDPEARALTIPDLGDLLTWLMAAASATGKAAASAGRDSATVTQNDDDPR